MNPRDKHRTQIQTTTVTAAVSSGPLPPPEKLEQYERICPGAADRIIALAERQSAHRQSIETKVVDAGRSAQTRGQYFGFVLSMVVISGGFALIYIDKSIAGVSAIIANLIGLVTVFVVGRKKTTKELQDKASAFGPQSPS